MPPPEVEKEKAEPPTDQAVLGKRTISNWRPLEALARLRAIEALRYREFRLLWYGQVFTSMATWMDSIARGWLIYELTDSSFQLGLVRGVQAIPTLLLSPIAGSAADLYSRKTQILIAQIVDGLLYAWVAVMIISGEIAMARLCDFTWTRHRTSVSAALQNFHGFRFGTCGLLDQRHGTQRCGLQIQRAAPGRR